MRAHLLVSTQCPTCGAPLDFGEGSTAVRCAHCRSNLLVTGRKQVLSFYIPPRVAQGAATKTAAKECQGRITLAELYFLPYYRFTGHDYICFSATGDGASRTAGSAPMQPIAVPKVAPQEPGFFDQLADHPIVTGANTDVFKLTDWLFELLFQGGVWLYRAVTGTRAHAAHAAHTMAELEIIAAVNRSRKPDVETIETETRHIEKNFIASRLDRPPLFSIGVRASVLKLHLFRADEVRAQGKIATVTVPVDEALARGERDARRATLLRATVSPSLNVIYFPYWFIDDETHAGMTVVDAISGAIADKNVPESVLELLARTSVATGATIGFRPLVCPNCGWDLPLQPHHVAFFCSKCARAWQLEGSQLVSVASAVAHVDGIRHGEPVTYLPFWVIGGPKRVFVPGFRYRNLKVMQNLAANLTGMQPKYEIAEAPPGATFVGSYYDAEDAKTLARFIDARGRLLRGGAPEEIALGEPVLTWFPFRGKGAFFHDPFLRTDLYRNLFVD